MNWDATYDFSSQDFGFCSSFCGILARFFQFQLWFEIIIVHDFLEGCVSSNMLCEDSNNCLSTYFASFRRFPSSRRLPPSPMISQSSSFTGRFPPALLLWWGVRAPPQAEESIDRLTDWLHPPLLLHCGKVEEWKSGREEERTAQIIPYRHRREKGESLSGVVRERERVRERK